MMNSKYVLNTRKNYFSFTYFCPMQFFKRLFQFYIFGNIHVAIATFCLVKITLLQYEIIENKTAMFVFFSTLVSYNLIRFLRISDIANWFSDWLRRNRKLLYLLTIISAVSVGYLIFQLKFNALLWLSPFVVFTFFYGVSLPIKNKPLRKFAGMKSFLIAISYAGITVLFPLVQNDVEINIQVWIVFMQRFLFISMIIIPFDIRDLHVDSKSLKTLPQLFGVKMTKILGFIFGLIFVLLEFLKSSFVMNQLIIVLIVTVISSLFLIYSKENQSKYYSSFWVESLPIFWFLLVYIIS